MKSGKLAIILILICWFLTSPSSLRAEEWYQGHPGQWQRQGNNGSGEAPTATTGIRGGKETGTKSKTAGSTTATTATNIGRGAMVGGGTTVGDTARKAARTTTAHPATIEPTSSSRSSKDGKANIETRHGAG
jgi:hypothetical protein